MYSSSTKNNRGRLFSFAIVAALHVAALFLIAFSPEVAEFVAEVPAKIMRLADIKEEIPKPPAPVIPPPQAVAAVENAETIAETVVETEEPVEATFTTEALAVEGTPVITQQEEEYFPMNKISKRPEFEEREIRSALVYPPIALRSKIEGRVILELYIDKTGAVKRITVMSEKPEGRGFADAAIKAFEKLKARPAEINGVAVGVRLRWPVTFRMAN